VATWSLFCAYHWVLFALRFFRAEKKKKRQKNKRWRRTFGKGGARARKSCRGFHFNQTLWHTRVPASQIPKNETVTRMAQQARKPAVRGLVALAADRLRRVTTWQDCSVLVLAWEQTGDSGARIPSAADPAPPSSLKKPKPSPPVGKGLLFVQPRGVCKPGLGISSKKPRAHSFGQGKVKAVLRQRSGRSWLACCPVATDERRRFAAPGWLPDKRHSCVVRPSTNKDSSEIQCPAPFSGRYGQSVFSCKVGTGCQTWPRLHRNGGRSSGACRGDPFAWSGPRRRGNIAYKLIGPGLLPPEENIDSLVPQGPDRGKASTGRQYCAGQLVKTCGGSP